MQEHSNFKKISCWWELIKKYRIVSIYLGLISVKYTRGKGINLNVMFKDPNLKLLLPHNKVVI